MKQISALLIAVVLLISCGETRQGDLATSYEQAWVVQIPEHGIHDFVVEDESVYVTTLLGEKIYKINKSSGQVEWTRSEKAFSKEIGVTFAPFVFGSDVYAMSGNKLVCLSVESGEINWEFLIDDSRLGKGFVLKPDVSSNLIVFPSNNGNLYCLDASSGRKNWETKCLQKSNDERERYTRDIYQDDIFQSVTIFGERLIATTKSGRIEIRYLSTGNFIQSFENWVLPDDGVIFASDRLLLCEYGNSTIGPVTVALDANNREIVWTKADHKNSDPSRKQLAVQPIVFGDALFVAQENRVYSYSVDTGVQSGVISFAGTVNDFDVSKDYVIAAVGDTLTAIDFDGKLFFSFESKYGDEILHVACDGGMIFYQTVSALYCAFGW